MQIEKIALVPHYHRGKLSRASHRVRLIIPSSGNHQECCSQEKEIMWHNSWWFRGDFCKDIWKWTRVSNRICLPLAVNRVFRWRWLWGNSTTAPKPWPGSGMSREGPLVLRTASVSRVVSDKPRSGSFQPGEAWRTEAHSWNLGSLVPGPHTTVHLASLTTRPHRGVWKPSC